MIRVVATVHPLSMDCSSVFSPTVADKAAKSHKRAKSVGRDNASADVGGLYAIRSLISIARCAIKTQIPLNEYSNLILCQKKSFVGSSYPKKHISKSKERDSEMLNLVSKCAQYWQKASIHELSIYKL